MYVNLLVSLSFFLLTEPIILQRNRVLDHKVHRGARKYWKILQKPENLDAQVLNSWKIVCRCNFRLYEILISGLEALKAVE